MKLIKISPKYQITIPRFCRNLCRTGWFSFNVEDGIIILRPIVIEEAKTEQEFLEEIMRKSRDVEN